MTREQSKRLERFVDISDVSHYPFVTQDALRFICGDKISEGQYRAVFDCDLFKGYVVKVSYTPFANITEFEVWQAVKGTPHAKWFAPCLNISPCGHFLIQKKVRAISDKDKLPKKLPNVFTDIKKTNFGFIGKQLVCHDYQMLCRAIDASFLTNYVVEWKE
jgi:hypothetical protein